MTTFTDLNLIKPLLKALGEEGYTKPTPIQEQAIPPLLEGRDVLGCAQTGTGKTAAFSLPILQFLSEKKPRPGKVDIKVLVLTPTRELAAQLGESFESYGRYLNNRHFVVFGGVNERPQISALKKGIDILVATPGRLLDLHSRGYIDLSTVEFFVLDEADRMLDMGFIHDVKRVLEALPKKKQNLLFSATMPKAIASLAGSFLKNPVSVEVTPESTTVERINQSVMFVERANKRRLLAQLMTEQNIGKAIVFTRTKHGANRLVKQLDKSDITAVAIHGNKSQAARNRALADFKAGKALALVATDIASRGIDIDDITHVFNFDLPNEPESYVHRIGRTGRAGREGIAIAFCDETEGAYLRDIEKIIRMRIPVVADHEFHSEAAVPGERPKRPKGPSGNRSRSPRGRNNQRRGGGGGRPGGKPSGGKPSGGQKKRRSQGPRRGPKKPSSSGTT